MGKGHKDDHKPAPCRHVTAGQGGRRGVALRLEAVLESWGEQPALVSAAAAS